MTGKPDCYYFLRVYKGPHGDVRLGKVPGDLAQDGTFIVSETRRLERRSLNNVMWDDNRAVKMVFAEKPNGQKKDAVGGCGCGVGFVGARGPCECRSIVGCR